MGACACLCASVFVVVSVCWCASVSVSVAIIFLFRPALNANFPFPRPCISPSPPPTTYKTPMRWLLSPLGKKNLFLSAAPPRLARLFVGMAQVHRASRRPYGKVSFTAAAAAAATAPPLPPPPPPLPPPPFAFPSPFPWLSFAIRSSVRCVSFGTPVPFLRHSSALY